MYKRTKIEAEVHPRFLCLEEFMNYTGLGRGSAMKLGKEIGCVMKVGKGYFEDTPKTRTSTRDIPLTAAITEHIEAQRKYWGFKVVRMDQYLFCNENGDPISRERIQGEIDRIIKRIKSDGYDFPRITSHGRVIIRTS